MLHSMNRGGAETMIMNYYLHIDREQVQFDFLLTIQEKSDYEDEILALGGKIYHITPLTLRTMRSYLKEIKTFLQKHPEYKIVHSHNSSKSVFPLGIAKKVGVPIRISHSHDMGSKGAMLSLKEMLRCVLRVPLKRVSTQNFACSKEAALWLYGKHYWENKKVTVLENAIDTNIFSYNKETREKYRKQYGISEELVIGHVGRFDKIKNHAFLLEIFAQIKKKQENVKFVLVGDGPLRTEMERKAEDLGIKDKIIFTGITNEVSNYLQMMDVFIFPSLYEGLGIVLIEAQASGLPCLASKGVVPEEAKVTDLVQFVSLKESPAYWAEMAIRAKVSEERITKIDEVKKAGYDICDAAKKLEEFYLMQYKA